MLRKILKALVPVSVSRYREARRILAEAETPSFCCPDCFTSIEAHDVPTCPSCGWAVIEDENLQIMFDSEGQKNCLTGKRSEYAENYNQISEDDLHESLVDVAAHDLIAKQTVDYLGLGKGERICEIGVGQGGLAREILKHNIEKYVGVDIAAPYLKELPKSDKIERILADAEKLPFVNTFDVVVSCDVMEHVMNVGSYLFSINNALKAGGRVVFRVPFKEDLLSYSPHLGCPYTFTHFRSFDESIIKVYLEGAGFKVKTTKRMSYLQYGFLPYVNEIPLVAIGFNRLFTAMFGEKYCYNPKMPSFLLKLTMRPIELLVIAEKIRHIDRIKVK